MDTAFSIQKVAQKLSMCKQTRFLRNHFTKGSFENLAGIVRSCLKRKTSGNLSVFSCDVKKCISTMRYFLSHAKWNLSCVRESLRIHMMRSPVTKIGEGDIASFDESSISKRGDSFEFIGDTWDGAEGKIKDGYTFLGCCIVSKEKNTRWLFDEIIYSNKDPKFRGMFVYLRRMLKRLFEKTNIATVVFDAGFRNQYILKYVMNEGKEFVLRVLPSMVVWNEEKTKKWKLGSLGKSKQATYYDCLIQKKNIRISVYTGVMHAWVRTIKDPLTVVYVRHPSFHNPLILATNKKVETLEEAINVYATYLKRWKIEILFQDIKEMGLETFRVRSKKAILRFIFVIILVHSILTLNTHWVKAQEMLAQMIVSFLRRKRKIKKLLFGGMKILYELLFDGDVKLREVLEGT